MESKGDVDVHEERPSSPLWVLHQISEEAVRVANEYLGSANTSPVWTGHKRSQSEVVSHSHRRSNSFQNLKSQISKAWRWGGNSQYENGRVNYNPEVLANQKRQWCQLHTQVCLNVYICFMQLAVSYDTFLPPLLDVSWNYTL